MLPEQYRIQGSDLQFLEVALPPKGKFLAEQGAMMYMSKNISMKAILGDGRASSFGGVGRFGNAIKRKFMGESMFTGLYTNNSSSVEVLAISAPSVGKIVPVELGDVGGQLICQKGAYLAGETGQTLKLAFQKKIRVGFFGGEGFIMQKIEGKGTVFIHASGALKEIMLGVGEELVVDSGCLVAVAPTVRYDIKYTGSITTSILGGEGAFYASLSGPGKVWLQSLPMGRLSSTLMSSALTGKGKKRGGLATAYFIGFIILVLNILSVVYGGGGA